MDELKNTNTNNATPEAVESWGAVVTEAASQYQGEGTIEALKHIERTLGAERLEKMEFIDRVRLIGHVLGEGKTTTDAERMETILENFDEYVLDDCFSEGQAAEKYLEQIGYFDGVPEECRYLIDYFDYESWAQDWNIDAYIIRVFYNGTDPEDNKNKLFAGYVVFYL